MYSEAKEHTDNETRIDQENDPESGKTTSGVEDVNIQLETETKKIEKSQDIKISQEKIETVDENSNTPSASRVAVDESNTQEHNMESDHLTDSLKSGANAPVDKLDLNSNDLPVHSQEQVNAAILGDEAVDRSLQRDL
jgi:hypothetical protein